MSIPAHRKRVYSKDGDGEVDEDDEDEDMLERRITRRSSSLGEGEVIEVADAEDDQPAAPSPVDGEITILDAPQGTLAERRTSTDMDRLASGSRLSSRPRPISSRRARGTPMVELPARSGCTKRRLVVHAPTPGTDGNSNESKSSAPTQPISSRSSRTRRQPVVDIRRWSQEDLRPYSVHSSPDPNAVHTCPRGQQAARPLSKMSMKTDGKRQGDDDGSSKGADRTKDSAAKQAPPSKTHAKTTTRKTLPASASADSAPADSPMKLDDDDIPLSLPVPGSARSQRSTGRQTRPLTVDSASDSSEPVQKRLKKVITKRSATGIRLTPDLPPDKRAQAPIMPVMSDSEEGSSSPDPRRRTESVIRRGIARPTATGAIRKRGRIHGDNSDTDENGSDESARSAKPAKSLAQGISKSSMARAGATAKRSMGPRGCPSGAVSPRKRKARDPDRNATADQSDDDDLEMDEMKRFKTESRLRKQKETPFQRNLRKMKAKQRGIIESTTEEEEDGDDESSAESLNDSEEFYVTDDDDDEKARRQMPAQFRIESTQTPEYKFKVVLHYFVYLVVKGPKALPLRGSVADYFNPMLRDVRRLLDGYRNSRVRSQIWRTEFVKVLEKYPEYRVTQLEVGHPGCDACHISGRYSRFQVRLEGDPYNPDTHEPYEVDSEEERRKKKKKKAKAKRRARRIGAGFKPSSDDEDEPRLFHMGQYCNARARTYHSMSHWEDTLYYRVRAQVKLLRRAYGKSVPSDSEASTSETDLDEAEEEREDRRSHRHSRRDATRRTIAELRKRGNIPRYNDVDAITQWMDDRGDQAKELRWFNDLILSSEKLENNNDD